MKRKICFVKGKFTLRQQVFPWNFHFWVPLKRKGILVVITPMMPFKGENLNFFRDDRVDENKIGKF